MCTLYIYIYIYSYYCGVFLEPAGRRLENRASLIVESDLYMYMYIYIYIYILLSLLRLLFILLLLRRLDIEQV